MGDIQDRWIGNNDARRDALMQAIKGTTKGRWWTDPTSFFLFESDLSIDGLASHLKAAIDLDRDIAIVGMPHVKSARYRECL